MSQPVPPTEADPCWAHHVEAVNGQRIHYVRAGQGDPVVLLHGWPQTWYMWRKIIPALAQNYTVIARERIFLTHFYRDCYNPGAFTHADIDEYVASFSAPGAMRASMAHYGALFTDLQHNQENAKTPLAMPVLALGGAMSFGKYTEVSARRIAKDVRGGVIEGCAHWVAEEQPEALTTELLAFFGEEG